MELGLRQLLYIQRIEPAHFGFVEYRRRFLQTLYGELVDELLHGQLFVVVFGIPAEQRDIVDYGVRQKALRQKILEARVAVALAQLVRRVAHYRLQVNVYGSLPAERVV